MTDIKPLKIELGKTYIDGLGQKVRIICVDATGAWPVIGLVRQRNGDDVTERYKLGGSGGDYSSYSLIREYREPVVHKRDVVWFRSSGNVYCRSYNVGEPIDHRYTELSRQTVEYTEPQEDGQ